MQVRNTTTRWGAVSKGLHWLVVLLVIGQFVLANLADGLPLGMAKLGMLARHKSVGLTILALALLRLLWRSTQPTPLLPRSTPPLQRRLAQGTHVLLYGLLLAMPLSGWLMSSAKNYPVSWFGLFQLPDLVAPSESAYRALHGAHETLAGLLVLTALLHLLGALKHHLLDRDTVLRRMLPFVRGVVPFAVPAAALLAAMASPWVLAGAASAAQAAAATPVGPRPAAAAKAPAPALTHYVVDPARSTLEFEFKQAGASSKGRFTRFQAALTWPAAGTSPGAAALTVDIDTASLDTADKDRDLTLRGADLFAVERFPKARFEAMRWAPAAAAATWTVNGRLQIRDRTHPIAFPLTLRFEDEAGRRVATLRGETRLRRLEFGIGQGEWQSTEWVGDEVTVRWDLRLQQRP